MNEIMTREEFLKERNAVYEPDAVAGGGRCLQGTGCGYGGYDGGKRGR